MYSDALSSQDLPSLPVRPFETFVEEPGEGGHYVLWFKGRMLRGDRHLRSQ